MLESTKIKYIEALQRASKENRLVIFAGAGTSVDAGIPLWNELISKLTKNLPEDVKKNFKGDNLQLAEIFKEVSDDNDYYDSLESALLKYSKSPNSIHDAILSLNPCHIITTNYDTLLEESALINNRQYFTVVTDKDLPRNHGEKLIVKMHGDLKHHNVVLTENDYFDYSRNFPLIRSFIISLFVKNVVLFVGFSFNDPNLKYILREIKSELGNNIQHVYLLNDTSLSNIETNYQFRKGINVLTLTDREVKEELGKLGCDICQDESLQDKGKVLVNQLTLLNKYRKINGLIGLAHEFIKNNLRELRSLGNAWECMFPKNIDQDQHLVREGVCITLPSKYKDQFKHIISDKHRFFRIARTHFKEIYNIREALVEDDIYFIDDIPIESKSYARKRKMESKEDPLNYYYKLDLVKLTKKVEELRNRNLTYTIEDLELPYILFQTGHYYESYLIYDQLAPEMWKRGRYALFFICVFNKQSVSWPAVREIGFKAGNDADKIQKQYTSTNLAYELKQLQLPEGVYQLFTDMLSYKQLNSNLLQMSGVLQSIESQRRGAERGISWSYNEYIDNVVCNFVTFLDFLTSNYLIMDNNPNGSQYYNTIVQCLFNSNLIPNNNRQSKLENLFAESLIVIIEKVDTDSLKRILKDIGKDRKLTADDSFKSRINEFVNNLYVANSPRCQIIEDKVLEGMFKNIIIICNAIKDCPKYEHLDELILRYWDRLSLRTIAKDIYIYFTSHTISSKLAGEILSKEANDRINNYDLNSLTRLLVNIIAKDAMEWKDSSYLSYIEFHQDISFAASLLKILPKSNKPSVLNWLKDHFKTLYDVALTENICGCHLLDVNYFEKFKNNLYPNGPFGEMNLSSSLFNLHQRKDYDYIKKEIESLSLTVPCLRFFLEPLQFKEFDNINPLWLEYIQDEEMLSLLREPKKRAIIQKYYEEGKISGSLRDKINHLLWTL